MFFVIALRLFILSALLSMHVKESYAPKIWSRKGLDGDRLYILNKNSEELIEQVGWN